MAILEHPNQGSVVTVDYSTGGFKEPEMVKKRLAVVLSPKIRLRHHLCTIVPLSLSDPDPVMPYHCQIEIPFKMPKEWGNMERWVKGDMVNSVGFHRLNLLRLGKDKYGVRIYQHETLSAELFTKVRRCVLHGMGLSTLTKHLK